MILQLPREMLWTDFKTMDQFYELDPVNKDFCEVLMTLHEKPFDVKSDEVRVFNELYYQMTRMMYERPAPRDLAKYRLDIMRNLGWNYSVELIMSMLYFMNSLIEKRELRLNRFFAITIEEQYSKCLYWKPFKDCYNGIRRQERLAYDFPPRPVSPSVLADKYVPWKEITNDYDANAIKEILSLWDNVLARRILVKMIRLSFSSTSPRLRLAFNRQINSIEQTELFGKENNKDDNSEWENRINELDSKLLVLEKENAVFQQLTQDLQADNARLKALLEEKNIHGEARKFTLVEIVNYCKDCVEWNNADSIVSMLYRLLLANGCTQEDIEMVKSIETEFKNRKYGNTYIKEQTVIPSVGNYKPQITTQNIEAPMPSSGQQQEQKQLEHE